jgi:hypothetical protein
MLGLFMAVWVAPGLLDAQGRAPAPAAPDPLASPVKFQAAMAELKIKIVPAAK